MSWRASAVQALIPILNESRAMIAAGDLKAARKLVKDTYPFGLREYTPYKIWCEEVRRFLPGLYPSRKAEAAPTGPPLFQTTPTEEPKP